MEEFLEKLENPQKKVILIGSNYKFFALKQKPNPTETDALNIEGTRVLAKSCGGVIFQVDDIYKTESIEELERFGIKIILLVGERNISEFSKNYFESTKEILKSTHKKDQFEIVDILANTAADASAALNWDQFLKTQAQKIDQDKDQDKDQNKDQDKDQDKIVDIQTNTLAHVPMSGPSSQWSNWKAKATLHYRLKDRIRALKMYKVSYFLLARQCRSLKQEAENGDEDTENVTEFSLKRTEMAKEMAKVKLKLGKLFFEAAGHHSLADSVKSFDQLSTNSADFTLESCLYEALSSALRAICLQVFSKQSCKRTLKANKKFYKCLSQGAYKSKKEDSQLLEDLIDHDQIDVKRLRERDIFENYFVETNLADLQEIKRQRESYMKKLTSSQNVAELVERRLELANCLSDLARTNFEDIEKEKIKSSNSDEIMLSHTWKIERLKVTSLRFAMEALEWNPNQSEVLSTLRKNLSLLSILVRDIQSRATDIEKKLSMDAGFCLN